MSYDVVLIKKKTGKSVNWVSNPWGEGIDFIALISIEIYKTCDHSQL